MHSSQTAALSALAEGLANLFNEAVDLLPRMIVAAKAGKPLPQRDPARLAAVCAALSFVQDGRPQFLTLAHLEEGKVAHRMQEALVWIALDAVTCRSIEEHVSGATRAPGLLRSFGTRPKTGPQPALMNGYRKLLMGKHAKLRHPPGALCTIFHRIYRERDARKSVGAGCRIREAAF